MGTDPTAPGPPAGAGAGAGDAAPDLLRLDRLTKRYGSFVAVDRIDLSVAAGEVLTLLGPSGAGKTTVLMMIAGFETPTGGEILFDGRSLRAVPAHRRGFGMILQNHALFPHRDVFENIAFSLRMRKVGRNEREAQVHRALDLVGLSGFGDRHPDQLSKVQQHRVAVARAIVFGPRLLLMDEPLRALDQQARQEMQTELRALQRALGITLIQATEDREAALILSDRVAVINRGRIEQVGTPSALYDRPATRFVATFLGDANLIPVAPVPGADRPTGRLADGTRVAIPPTDGAPGATAWLVVRPEKLVFADDHGADPPDVVLDGMIEDTSFLGDAIRFRIRLSAAGMVTVKCLNRDRGRAFAAGATCRIGFNLRDVCLIADG